MVTPTLDPWSLAEVEAERLLADNTTQDISAADVRHVITLIISLARADIRQLEDRVYALEQRPVFPGHGGHK
jgi:hypothetical protein